MKKTINEFLQESNAIEQEYSKQALEDSWDAWNYLKDQSVITPEVILEVHRLLIKNLRPDIAGKWRDCDVWIGGQRKIFVSETLIKDDIETFCNMILLTLISNLSLQNIDPDSITETFKKLDIESKEKLSKSCHIDFEHIHPFEDVNGRTGRLIYLWHRIKLGLPIHIIHADLFMGGSEQKNYYSWFQK